MSHIVSLHFENPFKNRNIETKMDALDIPLSEGDHVEVVGIWQNEDGSIGIHVEVIEAIKYQEKQNKEPRSTNLDETTTDNLTPDIKAPNDSLTKSDGHDDHALELTPEMENVEEEFEDDFEQAAAEAQKLSKEEQFELQRKIEQSYERQKIQMPEISIPEEKI